MGASKRPIRQELGHLDILSDINGLSTQCSEMVPSRWGNSRGRRRESRGRTKSRTSNQTEKQSSADALARAPPLRKGLCGSHRRNRSARAAIAAPPLVVVAPACGLDDLAPGHRHSHCDVRGPISRADNCVPVEGSSATTGRGPPLRFHRPRSTSREWGRWRRR
jgi:hypothetical protein